MTFTFRSTNSDGTINGVELTPAQALDLGAGKPIVDFPRDERVHIGERDQITYHESATPQQPDEAA